MPSKTIVRAATDVGGTFTDLVYFHTNRETGEQIIRTGKVDTTPPDFERGVLEVLRENDVTPESLDFVAHGTTVVINTLTERKGAKVALITSTGFRDSIEIARGNRPDFFNLGYRKPAPFVPRHLRREIGGRMTYLGVEREAIDLTPLPDILEDFRGERVEAVAICLLHAYANPEHERRLMDAVRESWAEIPVVASHQITREWREYERTNTTILSAYVQPLAERYLQRLQEGMARDGFSGQLYVMQSNCGVDTLARSSAVPITMVESGPASGFLGAAELGRLLGIPNVLALDIGGTTAKCSLINDGSVRIMTDYWIERSPTSGGYPIMVPVVDLVEIGNGGGSIAWVDDFGKLHVGPQSAGAVPGPAAYGRGGREATTTDAHLVLGRINPEYFCGGRLQADMAAAVGALDRLGGSLGLSTREAACGVIRIANNNMVNALKLVSINRGHDPRDFTLVAFGGGGPLHAAALAAELNIGHVVIPRQADVFSAWGMLMSSLRRDYFATRLTPFIPDHAQTIRALIGEVVASATAQFEAEGVDSSSVSVQIFAKLRYENQEHHVEIAFPEGSFDLPRMKEVTEVFHATYEREYTYRLAAPLEFVGLHVVATADVGKLRLMPMRKTGTAVADARKGVREVDYALDGIHKADIYDGSLLEPESTFHGPAIIETAGMTIVVHPGNRVSIDDYGNYHLYLHEQSKRA